MAQGTFHIITFGCQMNVNDSFWLARSLQRRGFVESPLEKAEVVILNTCSVRDKPEQKVYAALGRIKYETRRVPGSFAVVAGCVAQQIGAGFFERFPQVRLVVGLTIRFVFFPYSRISFSVVTGAFNPSPIILSL